jgi:hypothetical protein
MAWFWKLQGASTAGGAPALGECRHCGSVLVVCGACGGQFDQGRLCQQCMFGAICPNTCQRHWTWA